LVANFWCCVGSFGFSVLPAVVDFVWISRKWFFSCAMVWFCG
jgi:hypothetical protein